MQSACYRLFDRDPTILILRTVLSFCLILNSKLKSGLLDLIGWLRVTNCTTGWNFWLHLNQIQLQGLITITNYHVVHLTHVFNSKLFQSLSIFVPHHSNMYLINNHFSYFITTILKIFAFNFPKPRITHHSRWLLVKTLHHNLPFGKQTHGQHFLLHTFDLIPFYSFMHPIHDLLLPHSIQSSFTSFILHSIFIHSKKCLKF